MASPIQSTTAPGPSYLDSQNTKYFPLELRQLIWKLAIPDPVIVMIGLEDAEEALRNLRPNLFGVCRESRLELLKQYEIIEGIYKTPLYIDFSRDAIHLTDSALQLEKHSLEIMNLLAAKTQRLIIPTHYGVPSAEAGRMTFTIDKSHPNLQNNQDWLVKYTTRIMIRIDRNNLWRDRMIFLSFPQLKNVGLVLSGEERREGNAEKLFMDMMALKAIYDKNSSEYETAKTGMAPNWSHAYHSLGGLKYLPVHGTTPMVRKEQNLPDWFCKCSDWQRAFALYYLAAGTCKLDWYLRHCHRHFHHNHLRKACMAARTSADGEKEIEKAAIKIERPSFSFLYPGKGVKYDVVSQGTPAGLNRAYALPELQLCHLPGGLEMVEVTVDDAFQEIPYRVQVYI